MTSTVLEPMAGGYDVNCRRCPRLSRYLDEVRREYPRHHCRPVAPFGDPTARLLIVGLAPGKHGANATGRPFTGDHAGLLLYRTLHRFGYADRPVSDHADDGLQLTGCRITNAVKCLPPQNKPEASEVSNCLPFLRYEIAALPPAAVLLALGALAHGAILRCLRLRLASYPFAHGALYHLRDDLTLVSSYHCSRYNTQTGRLTESMFEDVFRVVGEQLEV